MEILLGHHRQSGPGEDVMKRTPLLTKPRGRPHLIMITLHLQSHVLFSILQSSVEVTYDSRRRREWIRRGVSDGDCIHLCLVSTLSLHRAYLFLNAWTETRKKVKSDTAPKQ